MTDENRKRSERSDAPALDLRSERDQFLQKFTRGTRITDEFLREYEGLAQRRQAIEAEGRLARIEGQWWQFSLTARTEDEPSAVSLLNIARGRDGALELSGRAWQEDGTLSCRYWSEAAREKREPSGDGTPDLAAP